MLGVERTLTANRWAIIDEDDMISNDIIWNDCQW